MDNQIAVFEQKKIRQAEHIGEIYYRRNFETDTQRLVVSNEKFLKKPEENKALPTDEKTA